MLKRQIILFKIKRAGNTSKHGVINFRYTNWKGETADRSILAKSVSFSVKTTEWHGENRLIMTAIDREKNLPRDFCVDDIKKVYRSPRLP